MGKRPPIRPAYTASVAAMIEAGVTVRASCDQCGGWRDVDLAALAEAKGGSYDLWNRRTRCRITEGCQGRARFAFNGRGRFEPLRDP